MIILKKIPDLQKLLNGYRANNLSIGFVPTMGALHQGHIALISRAVIATDVSVCSIFVNPTQFNNSTDFEKYPVTLENDINMLEAAGCKILFLPSVVEMYPPGETVTFYDLGYIETLLEGKYRPGHFQGVCRIVDKLLEATRPQTLFIGQKDYQQCMVIKKMISLKNHPVHVEICETLREQDGLAMSSRNLRLQVAERKQAHHIYKILRKIKEEITEGDLSKVSMEAAQYLTGEGFAVDYVEIASAADLTPVKAWDGKQKLVALIAASLKDVRLIDNLLLN